MNTLSDTRLGTILKKLAPYRTPALDYIDMLKKNELTGENKTQLIHYLATAIQKVTSTRKQKQLHISIAKLHRMYQLEEKSREDDNQHADLLLQEIDNDR